MTDHEQYIRTWYASLCATSRQFELKADDTPCVHCGKPRKEHNYEERTCTLYVTSSQYRAVNRYEVELAGKTLTALENLASACGWNL